MAYSTLEQFIESFGSSFLTRVASRRDDAAVGDLGYVDMVPVRLQGALDEASAFMDGFFQVLHTTPIVTTVPAGLALLRGCCEQLAASQLVMRHGYTKNSEDESFVISQDRWRTFLRDVGAGKATVPGISASDNAGVGSAPVQGFYVAAAEPFYPDERPIYPDSVYQHAHRFR